ncbi:galactose oxidase [Schizopora paradoxa]|uniref:Galactose oxidase n=1 Tax=Schizopora paradoxa TaxID=27342 RepID=A0A0H2SA52_9AGAM|nr:galactose oxidase [Schizopora paradoxa]
MCAQEVSPGSSGEHPSWSTLEVQLEPPRLIPGRRAGVSSNPSPSPLPRHSHSLTATTTEAGDFLLFGGSMQGSSRNDVYTFSPGESSVTLLQTAGDAPSRRVAHKSVLVHKVLIVWGGDTRKDTQRDGYLDGGLYMLNLITSEWSRISIHGPSPRGRYGHTMSLVKNKLYVFGGQADSIYMNDLWVFDLVSLTRKARWELVNMGPDSDSVGPQRRSGHSSVTVGSRIYIFGGRESQFCYNDTWCFDTEKLLWAKLKCVGSLPTPREGHAAAVVNDVMYIFGGKGADGSVYGDLVALHLTQRRWYTFENLGCAPSARWGHTIAALGTCIHLLGGQIAENDHNDDNANSVSVLDVGFITYP